MSEPKLYPGMLEKLERRVAFLEQELRQTQQAIVGLCDRLHPALHGTKDDVLCLMRRWREQDGVS